MSVKYSLDNVAREHIIESLDDNMGYYSKVFFLLKTGLREFNQDLSLVSKTISIHPNCDNIFVLPSDFIDYSKIYTIDNKGSKFELALNIDIANTKDCNGAVNKSMTKGVTTYLNEGTIEDNHRGRHFGLNNQNYNKYGQYKVFEEHIVFSSLKTDCIYMDYICNEQDVTTDTRVHPYLIEPLKQWVRYKMAKDPNVRELERKNLTNAKRKLSMLLHNFTIDELKQAIRFNYTQSPKR